LVIQWSRPETGSHLALSAFFEEGEPAHEDLVRIACHHAIEFVPNEGLSELCEFLGQLITFHADRASARPVGYLAATTTSPATWGDSYERDPFTIVDED
jgi:hypothetical protein